MTAVLFDYPKNAAFGRVLPKNKIYEHGSVSSAVRQLFVRRWNRLSGSTSLPRRQST